MTLLVIIICQFAGVELLRLLLLFIDLHCPQGQPPVLVSIGWHAALTYNQFICLAS